MAPAPLTAGDLGDFPLFADLSEQERQPFLEGYRDLSVGPGQQVVQETDWSDGVYLVRQGIAKVRKVSQEGEEVVLALIGVKDVFGEMALLLSSGLRTADVLALTPMAIAKLRPELWQQALENQPRFARALARMEAERLQEMAQRLALRSEDATTRVLAPLLDLARRGSRSRDPQHPIPALAQREIATIAGLARGTTSTILTRLRSRGTLEDDPEGLRIANLEPLQRRHLLDA
jgi:CRP-like cAMP-binding protein